MISSWWKNKNSFGCLGVLLQPFAKLSPNSPEDGFSGYRIFPLLKKAWVLFQGISSVDRWRFAGAYFILLLASMIQERTYFEGPWQSFLFWFIHLVISTWALAVFVLPKEHRIKWKGNLVGVGIYIFLLDLICQLPWLLIFYGSLLTGIGVGWVLKYIHLPILYGKLTPDLLILIVPLILFLVAGFLLQWFLLGLSLVIPLMLDQKTGIWPAVRSSLSFTRGCRLQLFLLFGLVAALIGTPVLFTTAGKLMVQCLPYISSNILPPSSLGVWICFILQTMVLLFGTFLAVWLWPLGSALWAALYLERWKPNGNCKL